MARPTLVFGFVALIVAVILLSPLALTTLARLARHAPIAVRLAVRDLARYRARSGSALGAISLGVLIAVVICVVAAARYGNVLDYAGPNLASNQIILYTPNRPPGRRRTRRAPVTADSPEALEQDRTGHRRTRSAPPAPSSSTRPPPTCCTPRPGATSPVRSMSPPRSSSRPSGSPPPTSTHRPTS